MENQVPLTCLVGRTLKSTVNEGPFTSLVLKNAIGVGLLEESWLKLRIYSSTLKIINSSQVATCTFLYVTIA